MKNNNNKDDKEDIFITSKDKIYNNEVDNSYRTEHPKEDYLDIFCYENITQEYDFETGQTTLYLEKSNNEFEILYESSSLNGIESSSLYSKDSAYLVTNHNQKTGDIENVMYVSKTSFIKYISNFSDNMKNIYNSIKNNILSYVLASRATVLIENNNYLETSSNKALLKDFKRLFIKYTSVTKLIPVYNILNDIISNVHEYIATGKFIIEKFNKSYKELQSFSDVSSNTISLLSAFMENPDSTDLQSLCDNLEKNSQNIENLLNLYLEDELSLQDKEKDYDSE